MDRGAWGSPVNSSWWHLIFLENRCSQWESYRNTIIDQIRDSKTINRVTFNWVSKVIWDCTGFSLLCSMIGPKNSRHSLDQSDAKLQSITTWSPAFSCPLGGLLVFTLSFHLALQGIFLSSFHNNYFGFVLRHSIEKRSMNGNPYFPRRYKYSSSQRRNSSNLFFLVIYVHLLNLLSHLAWSPSPLPIKKHQINHFLTISFSKLWWSSWEVKFFLCPAPVKQQMKSEKNFVAHIVYTKSTLWWKCVTISGFHGQKTDQSRNKQDHVKESLPTCWASCD